MRLDLPFRPPYDWAALVAFLTPRAIPGVEEVAPTAYRRTFAVDGVHGTVEVRPLPGADRLVATVHAPAGPIPPGVLARLRKLFDLDADVAAITRHLGQAPELAPLVAARPGLRVPGAWDAFELAVRAILGQQVSVAAATTLAGRLVAAYGMPLPADARMPDDSAPRRLFPRPDVLAGADLTPLGLPGARARAISGLAAAVADDGRLLHAGDDLDATIARLCRLPGIGPWTAHYIAMRALRAADAFPASDLGLIRALATAAGRPTPAALARRAEAWRPWRAYAAMHLWMKDAP